MSDLARLHPIRWTPWSIGRILAGKKTQTHRPVKVRLQGGKMVAPFEPHYVETDGALFFRDAYGEYLPMATQAKYQPGDILYWANEPIEIVEIYGKTLDIQSRYMGNGPRRCDIPERIKPPKLGRYKGRCLPREWANPATLVKVTEVRCERIQDITSHDAGAEGMLYSQAFAEDIWDPIYFKKGDGWDANPWVFAYTFERWSDA